MAALSLRQRFRRLVPPGRPAQALGVPAGGEAVETELAGLLQALDAVAEEARRLEQDAVEEAERRRRGAIREAAAILDEAGGRADAERARAAAARTEAARADVQGVLDAAQRRAAELREGLDERVTGPLEAVVACVRRFGL